MSICLSVLCLDCSEAEEEESIYSEEESGSEAADGEDVPATYGGGEVWGVARGFSFFGGASFRSTLGEKNGSWRLLGLRIPYAPYGGWVLHREGDRYVW
jgi:hypothetical protein